MEQRIRETSDYNKFELHFLNREVLKVKHLETSMRKYGWIDAFPMLVIRNGNKKLYIKDGHHRFSVAKSLGIPVKYVVCQEDIGVHELQKSTNQWSMRDYLGSYVRAGYPAYMTVKEYHERTGIAVNQCVSMLGGESASSSNKDVAFKEGRYSLGDPTHAVMVGDIITHCRKAGIKWANNHLFVQAVSRIAYLPEFDAKVFKNKVSTFPGLMEKRPNLESYLNLIEDVYNRQNRKRIPLRFLSDEAAKKRSAAPRS
jgi:hypothetical protein